MIVPPMLTPGDIKIAGDVTKIVKTMVETAVAFFKNLQRNRPTKDGDRKKGKFNPKRGDKVNTIVLVGMEGVGKTELIKNAFGTPRRIPPQRPTNLQSTHLRPLKIENVGSMWLTIKARG